MKMAIIMVALSSILFVLPFSDKAFNVTDENTLPIYDEERRVFLQSLELSPKEIFAGMEYVLLAHKPGNQFTSSDSTKIFFIIGGPYCFELGQHFYEEINVHYLAYRAPPPFLTDTAMAHVYPFPPDVSRLFLARHIVNIATDGMHVHTQTLVGDVFTPVLHEIFWGSEKLYEVLLEDHEDFCYATVTENVALSSAFLHSTSNLSPDGRFVTFPSIQARDMHSGYDVEGLLPGFFIQEVDTGKTVFYPIPLNVHDMRATGPDYLIVNWVNRNGLYRLSGQFEKGGFA